MSDRELNNYVRLMNSISLPQTEKQKIEDELLRQINAVKKEISKKYFVAASAAAVIAAGIFLATREKRQDYRM